MRHIEPETIEEALLYNTLVLTWLWYALGALYLVPPVVAWTLMGVWIWRWVTIDETLPNRPLTPLAAIWWIGMLVMLIALLVGHANWDLGVPLMIKSSIGWMKGWALFAVFGTVGACLHVRPQVLYRAATILALQTLVIIPLFVLAPMIGLPGKLYVSPVSLLGGPGPEYFEVQLYGAAFDGGVRWRFFAPWAPAASVAFGVLTPLIIRDRNVLQRGLCLLTVVIVIMMSKSRLGLLSIPLAALATYGLSRLTQPKVLLVTGAALCFGFLLGDIVLDQIAAQKERMNQMRADSTYVRDALGRIAVHRWITEAPVWGHGVVEPGPHLVEFMPIGSHHSWYGLLFVKGAVGFTALLMPLLFTLVELIAKAQLDRTARTALTLTLLFSLFTFTENVEMLAYLLWPAFVLIGIASRRPLRLRAPVPAASSHAARPEGAALAA